jgi:metal-responsive CopG/Arc/MetJ family transcriptional regulator
MANQKSVLGSTEYYLRQGRRIVSVIFPAELVVEFDRRIHEAGFLTRSSVATRAFRHYLTCPDADWEAEDPTLS